MKGLLYAGCVLNKKFFITAGIAGTAATILAVIGVLNVDTNRFFKEIAYFLFLIAAGLPGCIALEFPARDLEKNIKSRFANYALAGGISKNQFVLAELLKNLLCVIGGVLFCGMVGLILMAVNPGYIVARSLVLPMLIIVLMGAMEWAVMPLTISFKSAEKAGLTLGLFIGFGICLPASTFFANELRGGSSSNILSLLVEPWLPWATLGFAVVVYAVVYVILLARVKRGDVC